MTCFLLVWFLSGFLAMAYQIYVVERELDIEKLILSVLGTLLGCITLIMFIMARSNIDWNPVIWKRK